jgi:transposase
MLYAGLDLSRKRLDFHLLDGEGATLDVGAAPPDADGLQHLSERVAPHGAPVLASIESMNGARFVHDRLELAGWRVEIADAQKVKGLAPLACKTDRIDAWVLAELARRDLVPAIWLPDPLVRAERERARWRLHLVRHRSSLKQRVHAVLLTHGKPCPVSDLFGVRGRQLLARLGLPEPWQGTIEASLRLIDELDREIADCERELRRLGATHRYVPLLRTVPGIGWVLAYTIAAEIGDISRFPSAQAGRLQRPLPTRLPIRRARPARPTRQARTALPPLGARRGRHPCLHPPHLPRPLPTTENARRQTARCQGRAGRPRPPTRPSDLAHAHPRPTLRSGRRHRPPGRLTALKEMRHRSELQSALSSPTRRR